MSSSEQRAAGAGAAFKARCGARRGWRRMIRMMTRGTRAVGRERQATRGRSSLSGPRFRRFGCTAAGRAEHVPQRQNCIDPRKETLRESAISPRRPPCVSVRAISRAAAAARRVARAQPPMFGKVTVPQRFLRSRAGANRRRQARRGFFRAAAAAAARRRPDGARARRRPVESGSDAAALAQSCHIAGV